MGGQRTAKARYRRRTATLAALACLTAVPLAMATVASPVSALSARSATPPLSATAAASDVSVGRPGARSYYVALGDSVPVWDGSHSYAHLLENHYVASIPGLTLKDMAVSEATTTSMLDGGQYQAALRFLHQHAGHIALITIDIGGNDVVHCATPTGIDMTCITNGLASVKKNLTTMLAGLAPAAPSVRVIGMNYYDPYLGDWLGGGATRTLALGSLAVVAELNSDLESVYGGPAVTADVQDTFKTADDVSMVGSAWGRIPVDVDRACSWLDIICHRGEPEGFGDDPNITGQMKIAAAFERLIGRLRAP